MGKAKAKAREEARLTVSRHAASLFVRQGLAATSGGDIARAAGVSKRTVWRYFRSKEACVEPLLEASALRFASVLGEWPRTLSIEDHLQEAIMASARKVDEVADAVLAARLIAMLPEEPALRTAWLMACHRGEPALAEVIGARLGRSAEEFDVRLCAGAIMTAIRMVDEDICMASVNRMMPMAEAIGHLARAIRTASTLPICDPVQ